MPRRTHYWKQGESALGNPRPSIATRECICYGIKRSCDANALGVSCPCLTCSVKIIQVGISEVVYSQEYSMDEKVNIDPMQRQKDGLLTQTRLPPFLRKEG